jgi:hypothetical protein
VKLFFAVPGRLKINAKKSDGADIYHFLATYLDVLSDYEKYITLKNKYYVTGKIYKKAIWKSDFS